MGTGGGLVVIDFSARGNSAYFRHDGWSGQEPDRVWGIGPRCVLRVPLQTSGVAFVLEVELGPCHAPPEIAGQIVRLRVNGAAIGWARLDAQAMIRCEIDTSIANRDGTQDIEFEFPGFYQPKMLGPSNDSRPLSAWFSFARLYTTDMFRPGPHFPASHPDIPVIGLHPPLAEPEPARTTAAPEVYTFGTAGKGETFLRDGWRHDGDSLNAAAALAQIALPAPVTTGPCMLRLDVWPPAGAEEGQDIILTLDRIVIGQLNLAEPATWVVPLPRELLPERGGDLNLGFLSSALRVAGEPGDAAPGFRLERISIVPRPASLPAPSVARDGHAAPATVARWFQSDDAAALPAATEAALGMDVVTLARGFESLGTTAEFGVAQRNLGLEVVNFFRFCDIPLPGLLRALSDDLRAATDPARARGRR